MFAVICLGFLVSCLRGSAAEAELAPPQDLNMITLNTNYTLSWVWDHRGDGAGAGAGAITFTAQYISRYRLKTKVPRWNTACGDTSHRSCDLTGLNLHYLSIYMLRVRANLDGRHSEWAMKEFCPDKEAHIGPPSKVELGAAGSALDVSLTDPQTSFNTSMREHLPNLSFYIHYWEMAHENQVRVVNSTTNMVTLSDLKAWTWYCVSVQSRYDFYDKTSSFTSQQCVQTEGPVPWWQIFLFFLGSLLVCFLVFLIILYGSHRCYRSCKTNFFPHDQLPPHLKERVFDSPGSDHRRLVISDSESEQLCEGVTVCPESAVLEIHSSPAPPAGLEGDSSCRHLRQNSSSSGDSGVYSAGRNSVVLQPNSCQSVPDVELSRERRLPPEQLKMMETQFRFSPVVSAEAVRDVSV